jgi:small subunit ribosomal protein S9
MNEDTQKKIKKGFISGTGRRKTAVARVFLWQEKGKTVINDKELGEYFPSEREQNKWLKPFHTVGVTNPETQFDISIKVEGSGKAAQLDAVIHGVSRALAEISEENSVALHKQGLMTRDSRMVERKKPNLHKARRAHQYSKR